MKTKTEKFALNKFQAALKIIKFLLWISIIGLGFTLIQTTGLIFKTNQVIIEVGIADRGKVSTHTMGDGDLVLDKGSLMFQSNTLLDKIIFKHVHGYYDFIPSLFNFAICLVLLLIIRSIETRTPYSLKIANKIQWIGFIYILYGLVSILISLYTHFRVIEFSNELLPRFTGLRNDMTGIVIGIFILIIAFIYRVGIHFQEENKLTI